MGLEHMNIRRIVEEELDDAREIVEEAKKRYMQGLKSSGLEAIPCFEAAIDLVPDYVDAWNKLGESYCKLSLYGKAESCYNKAQKIDPHNVETLLGLATVYHRREMYRSAITEYEYALAEEPENLRAWFGLAAVHKDTQCYVQAVTCWEKILEILDTFESLG